MLLFLQKSLDFYHRQFSFLLVVVFCYVCTLFLSVELIYKSLYFKEVVHTCQCLFKCLIAHDEMHRPPCHLSRWVMLKVCHMPSVVFIFLINSGCSNETLTIERSFVCRGFFFPLKNEKCQDCCKFTIEFLSPHFFDSYQLNIGDL